MRNVSCCDEMGSAVGLSRGGTVPCRHSMTPAPISTLASPNSGFSQSGVGTSQLQDAQSRACVGQASGSREKREKHTGD